MRIEALGRGAGVLLLIFVAVSPAHATILTFDETRDSTTLVVPTFGGSRVQDDYGDRVTGSSVTVPGGTFTYGEAGEGFTPNVVLDVYGGSATQGNPAAGLWGTAYGDLTNVVLGNQGSGTLNVRLIADTGFDVRLFGFDLAGWPNSDWTVARVEVLSGATSLFSAANVLVEGDFSGPRHTSFAFASPLVGPEILIQVDYSNLAFGEQDNIGIDNVRLGQNPIPEPGTLGLLALGLACLSVQTRKCVR